MLCSSMRVVSESSTTRTVRVGASCRAGPSDRAAPRRRGRRDRAPAGDCRRRRARRRPRSGWPGRTGKRRDDPAGAQQPVDADGGHAVGAGDDDGRPAAARRPRQAIERGSERDEGDGLLLVHDGIAGRAARDILGGEAQRAAHGIERDGVRLSPPSAPRPRRPAPRSRRARAGWPARWSCRRRARCGIDLAAEALGAFADDVQADAAARTSVTVPEVLMPPCKSRRSRPRLEVLGVAVEQAALHGHPAHRVEVDAAAVVAADEHHLAAAPRDMHRDLARGRLPRPRARLRARCHAPRRCGRSGAARPARPPARGRRGARRRLAFEDDALAQARAASRAVRSAREELPAGTRGRRRSAASRTWRSSRSI